MTQLAVNEIEIYLSPTVLLRYPLRTKNQRERDDTRRTFRYFESKQYLGCIKRLLKITQLTKRDCTDKSRTGRLQVI